MFRLISNQSIRSLLLCYVIWNWNFSLFDPIRRIFNKRSVSTRIKNSNNVCASCHQSFGSGKKRKLVDVCGHQRCYSCIVSTDKCPLCLSDDVKLNRKHLSFLNKFFNRDNIKKRRHATDTIESSHKRQKLQNLSGTLTNSSIGTDIQQNATSFQRTLERNFKRISTFSNVSRGEEKKKYQIKLKPLFFQVPERQSGNYFEGRQWLFEKIEQIFHKESNFILIQGRPGSGKTSIALQLVDYSCFGRRSEESFDLGKSSSLLNLAKHVVGYHFCQKSNRCTNMVPEFVHNLAAQLCQAPVLLPYRNLLLSESRYHEILSMESCIVDPMTSFIQGILDPINMLIKNGSLASSNYILVIDALDESEEDDGCVRKLKPFFLSILSKLPLWIKVILTSRDPVEELSFISLDDVTTNDNLRNDIHVFINKRIENSSDIQFNILNNRTSADDTFNSKFAKFLDATSQGCFLYVDTILNLIEKRHLVLKSDSFRIIPHTIDEMYLLIMNIKFNTLTSFESVKPVLEICLATVYPLTVLEIYHTLNSSLIRHFINWKEFLDMMDALMSSNIICKRNDGTIMIVHPTLIDWLKNQKERFSLNIRNGHAMIALRLIRLEHPIGAEKILELSYHILNAKMFRDESLNPFLLLCSCTDVNTAFGSTSNLSNPDFQINNLLLRANSNPNLITGCFNGSSALACFSYYGYADLVELLISFGADCNIKSKIGQTALHLAAERGHVSVVHLLVENGCQINHLDENGNTALVLAASNGHLDVVKLLLGYKLPDIIKFFSQNTEKALIAAILGGHYEICKFLLESKTLRLDFVDPKTGHVPLTAACSVGRSDIVRLLIECGAPINVKNRNKVSSLACAILEGHSDVVQHLLNHISANEMEKHVDQEGRTPLMIAASKGYVPIMDLLVSKGALITTRDEKGFSALSWACMNGHMQVIEWLLERGSDINGMDSLGRTPLSLAATESNAETVQLLINNGANIDHVDKNGLTAIDRAIEVSNASVVSRLLQNGAKIGPQSWAIADDKPDIIVLLLERSWNKIRSKKDEFRRSDILTKTSSGWNMNEYTLSGDQTL